MPILSPDEISTIFVVGFPADMREREFQNLFMFASGFEGASLKVPDLSESSGPTNESSNAPLFKQQIIGFARFQRRQDAMAARDHLNGRCVDQERGCVLKVEMAKKNLFIAPRKPSGSSMYSPQPRDDFVVGSEESSDDQVMMPIVKTTRSLSLSIPGNPSPVDISIPNTVFPSVDTRAAEIVKTGLTGPATRSFSLTAGSSPVSPVYIFGENPPCNTLYVGNLPLNADENELRDLFSRCEGYRRMSFKTKANGPMCFVEFDDVCLARKAMDSLYGTLLSSSTKGGIRLSYSKNPLGVRTFSENASVSTTRHPSTVPHATTPPTHQKFTFPFAPFPNLSTSGASTTYY